MNIMPHPADYQGRGWHDTTIQFLNFIRLNPRVYPELVKHTRENFNAGRGEYAIAAGIEYVRWFTDAVDESRGFKIKSDFAAYFSRLIMAQELDLEGVFQLRKSIADDDEGWIDEAIRIINGHRPSGWAA